MLVLLGGENNDGISCLLPADKSKTKAHAKSYHSAKAVVEMCNIHWGHPSCWHAASSCMAMYGQWHLPCVTSSTGEGDNRPKGALHIKTCKSTAPQGSQVACGWFPKQIQELEGRYSEIFSHRLLSA